MNAKEVLYIAELQDTIARQKMALRDDDRVMTQMQDEANKLRADNIWLRANLTVAQEELDDALADVAILQDRIDRIVDGEQQ